MFTTDVVALLQIILANKIALQQLTIMQESLKGNQKRCITYLKRTVQMVFEMMKAHSPGIKPVKSFEDLMH